MIYDESFICILCISRSSTGKEPYESHKKEKQEVHFIIIFSFILEFS